MVKILGWINVFILMLTSFVYSGRTIDKLIFQGKNQTFKNFIKLSSNWHSYLAVLLITISALHGYLALGGMLYFHTGYLLSFTIILTGIIGILFKLQKKKQLFKLHKILAVLIIIFLIWHIISVN